MKWLIILSSAFFLFSCSEPPPRTKLTKAETELVDSLYSDIAGLIRKDGDSICDKIWPDLYQRNVDSIKTEYLKEIELILNEGGN